MDYSVQLNTPPGLMLDSDDYFTMKPKLSLDVHLDKYLGADYDDHPNDSYSRSRSPYSPTQDDEDDSRISRSLASLASISSLKNEGPSKTIEDNTKGHSYKWTSFTPFTPLSPSIISNGLPSAIPTNSLPPSPFSVQPANPDYTPYNFLLVDDNAINLLILEKVLSKICPRASTVKVLDPTKVASILKVQKFDIAFLDIEMPKVSGIELASHIRKYYQHGIIAVTTRIGELDLKTYKEVGIDDVFAKPLGGGYDLIMARIQNVLQRQETRN